MQAPNTALAILLIVLPLQQPEPKPAAHPVCDAGGPYAAECNGPLASVQLDGTGSYDPSGHPLRFKWSIECGSGYLDDPKSPTPTLFHPMTACSIACGRVDLKVTSPGGVSVCGTDVSFLDTTPPALTCPPNVSVLSGAPFDPSVTGFATALDTCQAALAITWSDVTLPGVVPEQTLVVRTWVADDGCQSISCDQEITIAPYIIPHVDIRPLECPNPFLVSGMASSATNVPASVLGNAFDPSAINPNTVRMSKGAFSGISEGLVVDFITPLSIGIGDTETPFIGPLCGCHAVGPDNLLDLNLRFSELQIKFGLGLVNEPIGSEVPLTISGELLDGTPWAGVDCVLIQ
jgi:hypothetical protein